MQHEENPAEHYTLLSALVRNLEDHWDEAVGKQDWVPLGSGACTWQPAARLTSTPPDQTLGVKLGPADLPVCPRPDFTRAASSLAPESRSLRARISSGLQR